MSSSKFLALVTGANKGIGKAIVSALFQKLKEGTVILASRSKDRGDAAIQDIKKTCSNAGVNVICHELDISNKNSILAIKDFISKEFGGLDILVNNAGVSFDLMIPPGQETISLKENAEKTFETNFFALVNICEILFPLLRDHARVVNVSSLLGSPNIIASESLRKQFLSSDITIDKLKALANKYIQDCSQNEYKEEWSAKSHPYHASKLCVSVLTKILQKNLDASKGVHSDILVNAAHPGYVSTDMTKHLGVLTVDQGAETPVYLATLPPKVSEPRGELLSEKKVLQLSKIPLM